MLILKTCHQGLFFKKFFLYFKFTRTHNSTIQKQKNSEIQIQNKTQTLRKSYTFLRVCTRREHININNYNNHNNDNNNKTNNKLNKKERKKERKKIEREREKKVNVKTLNIY